MPSSSFNALKYLLILSLLFCFKASSAQDKYAELGFRIDSFANVGLPKSALKEVERLDALARKNNNAPQQVRAVIYRMTFQSYLEENALVAIINRLKTDIDNAGYPVKPVLQSLLAQMYWNYYQQNRYQFSRRSKLDTAGHDFTNWDLQTIINETSRLYELSLKDAEKEQATPVGVLDGVLEGDKSTRYLRPTLYDLLVNRAFDFLLSDEAAINKPRLPFSINDARFFSDSRTFAGLTIKTTDTASVYYRGMKYLQQATLFHLQKNTEEALADVDLKRLEFLHEKTTLPYKDTMYLKALRQIASDFSAKPISANALLLAGQYYQDKDSLAIAYSYLKKAIAAYPNSLYGKNAAILIREIEEKALSATVEDVNVPDKPLPGIINYTNVKEARVAIYKLSADQFKQLLAQDNMYGGNTITPTDKVMKFLNGQQPVQAEQLSLPGTADYRKHSAEFKIDALPVGIYVILVKDAQSNSGSLMQLTSFTVTGLAYSGRENPDGQSELRITDRDSGMPLQGVNIAIYKYVNVMNGSQKKTLAFSGLSDANGKYTYAKDQHDYERYSITLTYKNDSYTKNYRSYYGAAAPYDNGRVQINTVFFTDRQLYRPGQTIYFKGLHITTQNGKSNILPGGDINVEFKDLNNKTIGTVNLPVNEFGSIQGSLVIPQTLANGQLSIVASDGRTFVMVEEYKRPTFQVEFKPVTAIYKFNDSVKVKGTVMAFSGYGLSQARVAYHIVRQPRQRLFEDYNPYMKIRPLNEQTAEIKTDTIQTNDKGEFEVNFKAIPGEDDLDDIAYDYNITADATDGSGETRSGNTIVSISNKPLQIMATIPQKLLAKDTAAIPVSLANIYGKPQKGSLNVKVYALNAPPQVFKTRLWEKPDQYILNKEAFKKAFPALAWKNEEDVNTWEKTAKVIDVTINTDTTTESTLDFAALKKQPSGLYKVIISGRGDGGDTTSLTRYINVITAPGKAIKMEDWATPLVTQVKPGGQAEFLLGINKPAHILMEQYDGMKLLSSEWLDLDGAVQRHINLPVPPTAHNDFTVQFLMVNDNRVYSHYQRIKVIDTVKKLNIRFLTFRNKLQPGEKEQWKLQVTNAGNKTPDAELLAALYDASLDDIAPQQFWQTSFEQADYTPNYFEWAQEELSRQNITHPYKENDEYFSLFERMYEGLDLFGYDYYGGDNEAYNDYLDRVAEYKKAEKADKKIAAEYSKNAALVKNGYDITGRVVTNIGGDGVSGTKIAIKNTGIGTLSNSQGYFKIKVPVNGVLVFSNKLYWVKELKTSKGGYFRVVIYDKRYESLDEVEVKTVKGITSADAAVTVDEPVGSSDVRAVRFAPPVAKPDMQVMGNAMRAKKDFSGSVGVVDVTDAKKMPGIASEQLLQGQAYDEPNKILNIAPRKPIIPRTNFNETAFFYPQLRTNEKGEIAIEFTIPEALTRWKFRGFAHTRDLETGYVENTVITQKQLSISANTPRFLREGDTITISARLASLNDSTLKGRVKLQLFNALNMQPVTLLVNKADADQSFEIAAHTNKAISFKMVVPASLDALTYRLTADAGQYTDGEENTLPVLPNRMLVTESMPMMVRAGQTRNFTFDKLVNQTSTTLQNKTLTLEYTQNPAWCAVQALPYMMEFPYECSEQIFSRYYANSLATNIVTKLPVIKRVFDQWKSTNSTEMLSNLEKNQELKATLIEETPWLKDAVSETEQKKRIALLFDLNKMTDELKLNLEKLQKRQLPDGGFPWFGGEGSDRFITQHILEGIGELYHVRIGADQPLLDQIATSAVFYQDTRLMDDDKQAKKNKGYATRTLDDIEIQAWFARSYFLNKTLNADMQKLLTSYLSRAADQWTFRNVYEQGLIALTMQRYKKPEVTAQIEKSLLETAQQSDDLGMYWAKNQAGYFWYESPIETQSLLIELFTEAGNNAKAVDEMKIWLLGNKQTSNWKTTKATAAACYALLLKGSNMLADSASSKIKLDGKSLESLKPEVKADAGTGYIKTSWADEQIKPSLGKVEIKNSSTNISWGALHWQYLENLDKITSSQTNIHLERKYFILKQTDGGPVLTTVDATHQPKTGDLLKVVVYLKAARDFEYVQLKDMRPAGTEPVDALSEYKYQDGLYYYQVTKDVATNFFISYLNKGNYVFEYQLRVSQPGNFSTGITSVQSMYAPEFNAHSQGGRMTIKP